MGVVAFWIALAAVLIAGGWVKSRTEAQKHETLRKLIEKGGTADEAQIRALFYPPAQQAGAPWWIRPRARGDGYRALRVCGTIAMCLGVGMIAFFAPLSRYAGEDDAIVGVGFGVVILAFGAGLFLASRFAERPVRDDAGMHSVE
jgi:hypothetical protein